MKYIDNLTSIEKLEKISNNLTGIHCMNVENNELLNKLIPAKNKKVGDRVIIITTDTHYYMDFIGIGQIIDCEINYRIRITDLIYHKSNLHTIGQVRAIFESEIYEVD